jgi:hypothetical protein
MNSDQFRCVVTDAAGSAVSDTVSLTVTSAIPAPVITVQPKDQIAVFDGFAAFGSATFTVTATGAESLTYQWKMQKGNDLIDIANATNATFTVSGLNFFNSGDRYRVAVSNSGGTVLSQSAIVLVVLPDCQPTFRSFIAGGLLDPNALSAFVGDTVQMYTYAEGYCPITYQWSFDGKAIAGATNASLILSNLVLTQQGTYQIRTFGGSIFTNKDLYLTVKPIPRDLPDLIIRRLTVDWFRGSRLRYSYDIQNVGNAELDWELTGQSGLFPWIQAYVSPDGDLNNPLNEPAGGVILQVRPPIAPGGIVSDNFGGEPVNIATHPYLILQILHNINIKESNETNNVAVRLIVPERPVLLNPVVTTNNQILIQAAGLWDRQFAVDVSTDFKSWKQKSVLDGKLYWYFKTNNINDSRVEGAASFYRLREIPP